MDKARGMLWLRHKLLAANCKFLDRALLHDCEHLLSDDCWQNGSAKALRGH